MSCPICDSRRTQVFDCRDRVPVHQNGRCATRDEALATPAVRLEMTGCLDCGFAWNAAFDPGLVIYDTRYENDQTCSPAFRHHVAACSDRVAAAVADLSDPRIVEVGCGQGGFLAAVVEKLGVASGTASGFDPAWRGRDGTGPNGCRIFRAFYDTGTAPLSGGPPDAVISRHTIEHVADPLAFLSGIRSAAGRPVRAFFETPCIDWIIANGQFQDLFYEHCSLFSAHCLALALRRSGFGPARVIDVFDGQYLWAESGFGSDMMPAVRIPDFSRWEHAKSQFLTHWKQVVADAAIDGPVYLWGGGSKGVTFALLVDADGDRLAGVVDINPVKQGGFLPMTGIPIVPPESIPPAGATVIVMNPAYLREIEAAIRSMGRRVAVHSLAQVNE